MTQESATVTRVEFDMEWPPGHVAMYVLDGAETILFDGGVPPERVDGASFAERSGYALDEIDHVFLTHPHPDHIGHLRAVVAAGDPVVHAPLTASDRLRRPPEVVAERTRQTIAASGADAETQATMREEERSIRDRIRRDLPLDAVDDWVVDDQRVTVGNRTVDAVWTPGHQADHLCYVTDVGGEHVIFSGDIAIEPFRPALLNDRLDLERHRAVADYRRSLDRLDALSIDRVYPGHGPIHEAFAATIERDRGSLDRRLTGVHDVLADGPATAVDVADAVVGDHDLVYLFPEVLAALCDLVNRGVAVREDGPNGERYRLA